MPTVVSLGPHDPVAGLAMCDDLWLLYREEIIERAGALATATMKAVNDALRAALAIP